MDMEKKKRLKQQAAYFYWRLSNILASVYVVEFKITKAHSSIDPTTAKYNIYV
jgi:hypothetical protein